MRIFFVAILIALAVPIVAHSSIAARAQDASWAGKKVLLTRVEIQFVTDSGSAQTVDLDSVPTDIHLVREEKDNWIKIATSLGNEAWCKKQDAVLLADADNYFSERIKRNPNDVYAYFGRISVSTHAGDTQSALKDATALAKLIPSAHAFKVRGIIMHESKEYDKAISDFNEALKLDPNLASAYTHRAASWLTKNEHDKAIADLTKAIQCGDKSAYAYDSRGFAYFEKQQFDEALNDFNEAIKRAPRNAAFVNQRAWAWWEKMEYEKSSIDFAKAVELEPNSLKALSDHAMFLASCLSAKYRNGKKAIEMARKAIELDRNINDWFLTVLAIAHAETGNFDEAIHWEELAIKTGRKNGVGASDIENYERALELFRGKTPYRQR